MTDNAPPRWAPLALAGAIALAAGAWFLSRPPAPTQEAARATDTGSLRESPDAARPHANRRPARATEPDADEPEAFDDEPAARRRGTAGAAAALPRPALRGSIRVSTLRHEVMHAQLHTGVGCMPAWFNEGAAQLFAGRPPVATWMTMLKERATFDFDALGAPTIAEAPKDDAPKLYAESLAMLLHVIDRPSQGGLAEVVQSLHEIDVADPELRARTLWRTLSPSTTPSHVRTSLARRLFGVSSEADLDAIFAGPVCCTGERRLADLTCRAETGEPPGDGLDGARSPASPRCRRY